MIASIYVEMVIYIPLFSYSGYNSKNIYFLILSVFESILFNSNPTFSIIGSQIDEREL